MRSLVNGLCNIGVRLILQVVYVTIDYAIEDYYSCGYDALSVDVEEGMTALCGYGSFEGHSVGPIMHLEFTSDGSVTDNGFTVEYFQLPGIQYKT